MVTAYVWSTDKVRRGVEVDLRDGATLTNTRQGSDEEVIADFGPHVGLIVSTHWGLTPFGKALLGRELCGVNSESA